METLTWILGVSSLALVILTVILAIVLPKMIGKTIKTEDAKAKGLIERMEKRTKEMLERMDVRTKDSQDTFQT